jgi:serine protease
MRRLAACTLLAASVAIPAARTHAADPDGFPHGNGPATNSVPAADGIIVKFKAGSARSRKQQLSAADVAELAESAALPIVQSRAMSGARQVLKVRTPSRIADIEAAARRLAERPDVEYAEPDRRKFAQRVPNDELYGYQWNYSDPVAGIDLPAAWDSDTGAASVIVAVADTGSRPHPDAGTTVSGYNFISDPFAANNGFGRGPSPIDTGDGVTPADAATHAGLTVAASSWHGEFVAGLIGAVSNNTIGIAGVVWNASMVHARVLGIGGGADSDILDGISWAAGFSVPGVPDNPNPARVINMSLGGAGPCGAAYQDTFNAIGAAGISIVLSAGNDDTDVAGNSPANCSGVIAVAATSRTGGKSSYSNFGGAPGAIALAAPGGDGPFADTILSHCNAGEYAPANEFYAWKQGTSFAAAEVTGVAALMLAVAPNLGPSQVAQILRDTARTFPAGTGNDCNPIRCGSGILDAGSAVAFARQMSAPPVVPTTGFWWSPAEPGIGFTIEEQGSRLFMASYLFDTSGRATWYGSGPAVASGAAYLGTLATYAGGTTLYGTFQPASVSGPAGDIVLTFSSPTQGTLSWPGGTLAVQHLDFSAANAGALPGTTTPESGWWWSSEEPGRGYAIEVQGDMLFVAGYMYDGLGKPIWYASGPAPMTNTSTYQGTWQEYAGGPSLNSGPLPARVSDGDAGAITIQFDSAASGTLTLPAGRQVPIQRFRY